MPAHRVALQEQRAKVRQAGECRCEASEAVDAIATEVQMLQCLREEVKWVIRKPEGARGPNATPERVARHRGVLKRRAGDVLDAVAGQRQAREGRKVREIVQGDDGISRQAQRLQVGQ